MVEYNTEKKHTEYKIMVENERIVQIIVQIPKTDVTTQFEEEIYVINADTLKEGMTRRICYKAFRRLWSEKNKMFLELERVIKTSQPDVFKIANDAARKRREYTM